jgi:hypothetical protein
MVLLGAHPILDAERILAAGKEAVAREGSGSSMLPARETGKIVQLLRAWDTRNSSQYANHCQG